MRNPRKKLKNIGLPVTNASSLRSLQLSPDETLLNVVPSAEKSSKKAPPDTGNSDSNNDTPQVSPVKTTKRKIAGDDSLVAKSSNAIQLYQEPTSFPPVGTILPPLVKSTETETETESEYN